MISKWRWVLLQLSRKLWIRATLFALLAIATALLAILVAPLIPGEVPGKIGARAVDHLLDILASSMLAVTTFSLGVMVSAYSAATSNVTPRATRLLMQDSTTQNMLGTFIGTFLFSLVGIVALSAGAYGERGRAVLFLVTIAVIVLIVVTMLRWIEHLSKLGRVGETTDRVEGAAHKAVAAQMRAPFLGGHPLMDPEREIPSKSWPVYPDSTGYIEHIDIEALASVARKRERRVFVVALPGTFVDPSRVMAWLESSDGDDEQTVRQARSAFSIDGERSFDQDPRFGLLVLGEIASRALSPSVNDPGTAIDVIGRAVRVLLRWAAGPTIDPDEALKYPEVWIPPIEVNELFDDVFTPIARDGASQVEIHVRLQKALQALANTGDERFQQSAMRHSQLAMKRAELSMRLEEDLQLLRDLTKVISV